jgi:hypothetical protein
MGLGSSGPKKIVISMPGKVGMCVKLQKGSALKMTTHIKS